jgi:hypothetical protein
VSSALAEYQRAPAPFILIEAQYEQLGTDADGARRQAYQAIFSGACGHFMGHDRIWRFSSGWRAALESRSYSSVPAISKLLKMLRWPDLAPVADAGLVIEGAGSGEWSAASSLSSDRRRAVVYVPKSHPITVSLEPIAGRRIRARWFEPATGALAVMPGSPWSRGKARTISPPAGAATGDWVALLEGLD